MILDRNDGSNRLTTRSVFDSEGNRKYRRKTAVAACTLLLLGGAAGAAWLAEGYGTTTSTETTGGQPQLPVNVTTTSANDALTPGASGDINVSISNPNCAGSNYNCGPAYVIQVSHVVVSVTGDTNATACPLGNFSITPGAFQTGPDEVDGPSTGVPVTLPWTLDDTPFAGDNGISTVGATPYLITLSASAPAGCENQTVNLTTTVS
jgi:hypothetical protein